MKNLFTPAFLKYLVLNLGLLLISEFLILKLILSSSDDGSAWILRLQLIGLLILTCQYPILVRYPHWAVRFALFMLGMLVGVALLGISLTDKTSQMPTAVFLFGLFGLIFGFLPCVVIVLINWLFEKQLYPSRTKTKV